MSRVRKFFAALRDDERGQAAMIFILAAPLLLACLGISFDYSRNVGTKVSLQNALDSAAEAAASIVVIDGDNLSIESTGATEAAKKVYQYNRNDIPFLYCTQTGSAQRSIGDAQKCDVEWKMVVEDGTKVTIWVTEANRNAFMHYFGMPEQTYHLSASASITDAVS